MTVPSWEKIASNCHKDQATLRQEGEELAEEYDLPSREGRRMIAKRYDVDESTQIENIDDVGESADILVRVESVFGLTPDKAIQHGILRDRTGYRRFVNWADSGVPFLEPGETYYLSDVWLGGDNNDIEIGKYSSLEETDRSLDMREKLHQIDGVVVEVTGNTGIRVINLNTGRSVIRDQPSDEDEIRYEFNGEMIIMNYDLNTREKIKQKIVLTQKTIESSLNEDVMYDLEEKTMRERLEEELRGEPIEVSGHLWKDRFYVEELRQITMTGQRSIDDPEYE